MDGPVPEPSEPSSTTQEPGTPAARLTQFQNQLAAKSPVATLTLAIIGINFVIYIGMLLTGVHFLNPDIPSLLKWGANLGSATTSGQWWRLFTCTFLHIGIIHILFNMYVLWDIGRFMERLIGSPGFAVVYFLSGLSGSVASMWWNPHIVSAGASGAIFGLYGCLIGYLLAGSHDIPVDVAKKLRTNALMFIGFNLIWGLTHRGIDMAGHLGGLMGGLVCGFAIAKGLQSGGISAKSRINLRVLAIGLMIVSLAAASRPKTVDFQQEIARFSETETKVQASYNQALRTARSGGLSDQDFARLIDAEVIAPWHSARLRLEGIHGLPEVQNRLLSRIERYAETRERAWVVFAEALRQQDPQGVQQANALHAEAEGQLKDLSK
jgi:rhomboid protease GluP